MKSLVMSGGGVKGAYAAGALKCLVQDHNNHYDIICGVSVGALNASFIGMYPQEDDYKSIDDLLDLWSSIDTSKIYKQWFPFGPVHALWKPSVYNSKPLQELVRSRLSLDLIRKSGKKVFVGAVSLDTGKYRLFTEQDDSFVDGVLASSAFSAMLTPVNIEGEIWTDGGVKEITPLKAAIDAGADEIDIIICSPTNTTAKFRQNSNALKIAERCIDLMTDEINANDIFIANLYNKSVLNGFEKNKRYIKIRTIRPENNLVDFSLEFKQDEIQSMIKKGYEDASKIINEE